MLKADMIVLRNWHVLYNALKASLNISPKLKFLDFTLSIFV